MMKIFITIPLYSFSINSIFSQNDQIRINNKLGLAKAYYYNNNYQEN